MEANSANTAKPVLQAGSASTNPKTSQKPPQKLPGTSVHKVPVGTSVYIRRNSATKVETPLSITPAEAVPAIQIKQEPGISLHQFPNPSTSVLRQTTSVPIPGTLVSSRHDGVLAIKEELPTVEEVSKGNLLRSCDSDSTLTASETEALEARMEQRKEIKLQPDLPAGTKRLRNEDGTFIKTTGGSRQAPPKVKTPRPAKPREKKSQPKKVEVIDLTSEEQIMHAIQLEKELFLKDIQAQARRREARPRESKTPCSAATPAVSVANSGVSEPLKTEPVVPMELSFPGPIPIPADDQKVVFEPVHVVPERNGPKLPYSFVEVEASDDEWAVSAEQQDTRFAQRARIAKSVSVDMGSCSDQYEELAKFRSRLRSVSVISDGTMDGSVGTLGGLSASMPSQSEPKSHQKDASKKKQGTREVHKIGTAPLTDLGRWKPQDDMRLITAVQEYRDLVLVHKHVKFTCHFTPIEIQERWFNLLYNKKVSKSSCQAMRSCPRDIMTEIQRQTPFSEAEDALLVEIPLLAERPDLETFELLRDANYHVFPPFRTTEDLEKHWHVLLADGRIKNSDTLCTIPEDQITLNSEKIFTFAEIESKMKDNELKNWVHVSGEFAYEMDKVQRQNREKMLNLDKEIEHLRYLVEKSLNYELPDIVRPSFSSAQDRTFLAVLVGQRAKFGMKTGKMSFGRCTPGKVVDVDLSLESYAGKLSRLQGYIVLERNGDFRIENHGRRPVFVDERILYYGDFCVLSDDSSIQVGDIHVQFYVNQSRVTRFLRQKYYGEWFSEEEAEEADKDKKKPKIVKKSSKPRRTAELQNITDLIPLYSNPPIPPALPPRPKKSRTKPKPPAAGMGESTPLVDLTQTLPPKAPRPIQTDSQHKTRQETARKEKPDPVEVPVPQTAPVVVAASRPLSETVVPKNYIGAPMTEPTRYVHLAQPGVSKPASIVTQVGPQSVFSVPSAVVPVLPQAAAAPVKKQTKPKAPPKTIKAAETVTLLHPNLSLTQKDPSSLVVAPKKAPAVHKPATAPVESQLVLDRGPGNPPPLRIVHVQNLDGGQSVLPAPQSLTEAPRQIFSAHPPGVVKIPTTLVGQCMFSIPNATTTTPSSSAKKPAGNARPPPKTTCITESVTIFPAPLIPKEVPSPQKVPRKLP